MIMPKGSYEIYISILFITPKLYETGIEFSSIESLAPNHTTSSINRAEIQSQGYLTQTTVIIYLSREWSK